MTLTLLVDLDNTLLGNDMETFIPAYLGALGAHLEDRVAPQKMVATMLEATQQMLENNSPTRTLKQAFDPVFYPPLGLVEAEMRDILKQFYAEKFPTLQGVTQYRPAAPVLVQAAVQQGFQVGIATNPLFPLTAIAQRLAWAGFETQDNTFSLVPSYETFHFAKPNPAYFAEFLGRIGWPEGPVLMVGNDPNHDVCGAQGMGIPVFWISDGGDQMPEGQHQPDGEGTLAEVYPWIESQPEGKLVPNFSSPSAMIATLRGSPAALTTLMDNLPLDNWITRPEPGAWSLTEIVCHLRDVEREINLRRLQVILQEQNPFIPGVDSDSWAIKRDYFHQDGPEALDEFLEARISTLEMLDRLTADDWNRPCRHAIFGPTELREIVHITAGHERLHGRQVYQTLYSRKKS